MPGKLTAGKLILFLRMVVGDFASVSDVRELDLQGGNEQLCQSESQKNSLK